MNRIFPIAITAIFLLMFGVTFLLEPPEIISLNGGCDQSNSPYLKNLKNEIRRISYCQGGDSDLNEIVSDPFILKDGLGFWYAGYPSRDGLKVSIVAASGDSLKIELPDAGENWVFYKKSIPAHLQGIEVTLVAKDGSSDALGWLGISSPTNISRWISKSLATGLAKSVIVGLLFFLVLASALSVFLRHYVIDLAAPLFLVSLGLVGYAAFFLYFWKVAAGIGFSILCLVLHVIFIARLVLNRKLSVLISSLKLLLPVFVLAIFIVFVGYFPFDSVAPDAWGTAANRWLSLPVDNWIPKIFADQIWAGQVQRPMVGDWLSSDRGPLQTGIVLIFYPLFPGDALLYQMVATMLQTLILLPAWLILRRFSIRKKSEIIFALGLSSLVFLHSLFVWPKLISATYVALVCLFIYANRKTVSSFHYITIVGTSSALAMLCHGGAVFPLVVLGMIYIVDIFRSTRRKRELYIGVICLFVFLLVMAPWLAYGKLIDPSHARLVKWHFAGQISPSEISVLDLLNTAYQRITFAEWLRGRITNFSAIFSGNLISDIVGGFSDIKGRSFFAFNYSMWFFSFYFVIPVWVIARLPALPSGISRFLTVSIGSIIVWVLAMYESGSTVIHQGSFFPWIGIFLVSCIALQRSSARLFRIALLGNLALLWVFYIPITSDVGFGVTMFYYILALLMFGWFFVSVRNMDTKGFDDGLCENAEAGH